LDEKDELRLSKPLIYQERDGDRSEIAGEHVVLNKRDVGIRVKKYDTAMPLVIDPILSYATYLGDWDAFVTKLNNAGDALVYSTFLGGNYMDHGWGITVDAFGNAYVTGETESTNFPTANPFQASKSINSDAFVVKIGAGLVSEFFFPEIAVGGGWSTTFELCNTGSTTTTGNLILKDQQGDPLIISSSELGTGSSFPISIPPGGAIFLNVGPLNPTDPPKDGWAMAEFWEGTPSGVATYRFDSEGDVTALAGVLPSQPMRYATITVDDIVSQDLITAYAIANQTSENLLVKLCFVDTEGNVVNDTSTIKLTPGGQTARYFFQDLNLSEFKGTIVLRAQSGGSFVAVGLIQNQELFTVVPVEASKAPQIPD